MITNKRRCQWIEGKPEFYVAYHDSIWGKPEHEDYLLFRWLILEMFHIGLSWQLILSKQAYFDEALDYFDVKKIANYNDEKIEELLTNKNIVRHRKKIEAMIVNAQAFLNIQRQWGSFDAFIWHFTDGKTIVKTMNHDQTSSELSEQVTHALKKEGFKFIGSVTIYSYLQAIGVINDHDLECEFR